MLSSAAARTTEEPQTSMRRAPRPIALLLVQLALLLQLASPAAAAAMAARMADPFAAMPICSVDREADGRTKDGQAPVHHDCQHCVACAAVAIPALEPGGTVALPQPAQVRVLKPRLTALASPRGPPLGRPNARAPPAFA